MAKIYGLFGAMSGKVADVVMSVRNGQQIVRKYQPNVMNPKTSDQNSTRARFKLMSQLAAILAPAIAFMRIGSVSARNMFTKYNFGLTSFSDNEADISLVDVSLTGSQRTLPAIHATVGEQGSLNVGMNSNTKPFADAIVYAAIWRDANGKLGLADVKICDAAGVNGHFETTITNVPSPVQGVLLAYGYKNADSNERVHFGNIEGRDAIAFLQENLNGANITEITMTKGVAFAANQAGREEEPEMKQTKKK